MAIGITDSCISELIIVECNYDHEGVSSYSDKKKASERLVAAAQFNLFPEAEEPDDEFADVQCTAYYYFVAVDAEGTISSELSSPRAIEGGQFSSFHERIFIINPGDIDQIKFVDDTDDAELPDFDVVVTSK